MKSIANLVLILCLLIFGCKQEAKEGNTMVHFIGNHDDTIEQDTVQQFIIVPMYGCIGCQDEMMNIWTYQHPDDYKLLTSNLRMLDDNEKKWQGLKERVLIDSNGRLDRIKFRFGDFNLVSIKNGKIIDNLPVMPDANRDSIITRFAERTY